MEREFSCWEIIFVSLGFTFGVDSISEEVLVLILSYYVEQS